MTNQIQLEICIASVEDAIAAEQGRADRVELNSALSLGGLTPSVGLLREVKESTSIPVIVMIRPRRAGFCYSPSEIRVMHRDIDMLLSHGADGIAFGILNEAGTVDISRCRQICKQAEGATIVFHRAFDVTPEPATALTQLIDLGIHRVMTSGGMPTAMEGADQIQRLMEQAKEQIEILPASGINPDNVIELLKRTGCRQIHASTRMHRQDQSCSANPNVAFDNTSSLQNDSYHCTSPETVTALRALLT